MSWVLTATRYCTPFSPLSSNTVAYRMQCYRTLSLEAKVIRFEMCIVVVIDVSVYFVVTSLQCDWMYNGHETQFILYYSTGI
eukprot:scaffold129607_cov53-Attheya_sp.AAC.6